ncbi:TonB-dependent receptor [Puniceicoccaceae bacterium K14]|nr:TonB-dependent receptor [Puniceicoccaceae bacterium K14]
MINRISFLGRTLLIVAFPLNFHTAAFCETTEHKPIGETIKLAPYNLVSTGTRTERIAKEAPIRTELLTSDTFRSAGARDLSSALEYLPGVRSEANCQNCGTAEIKMLGLGAGYNRLLFDGQPLFSGLASVYGIEQIPTAFISRIEVVKGGASSLYGPGAVAGVINILPNEPVVNKQSYDIAIESVKGQPFSSMSFIQDWSQAEGATALSVYGQFNDNTAIDLNGDGFSEITEKQFATIGINGWIYPTENGKLSLNYSYSWEKRRGGNAFDLLPHETQITEQLEHDWHRGGITWESQIGEINYQLTGSLSYVQRDSYYGGVGSVELPGEENYDATEYKTALEDSSLLYGYSDTTRHYFDSHFSKQLGNHYLSWGAQYQIDDVFDEKRDQHGNALRSDGSLADYKGQDPIASGDFSNLGIYAQNEWTPTTSTTFITGVRVDKHSELDDWIVSPRFALRYTSSDAWTWRASIATGFRAPEIFDEDLHIEILDDPTRTQNANDLNEESSTSFSARFVWTPKSNGNRWQVDGDIYRTEIRDTFIVPDIVYIDLNGNPYKERTNTDGAVIQGFELNTIYQLSKQWSTQVGITYVDAAFETAQEVLQGVFEKRYLETPEWGGVAQLKYENDKFVDIFLGLIYTGPMIAAREAEGSLNRNTSEFFVFDLTFTKHLHLDLRGKELHIDLMAGVKNLLDERQPDLTIGPDRDTTYFYGPRFPRSYVMRAGVNW